MLDDPSHPSNSTIEITILDAFDEEEEDEDDDTVTEDHKGQGNEIII